MILVTGAGGFIGSHVARALGTDCRPSPHRALDEASLLDGVAAILHAGRDPRLGTTDYRLEDDIELALARRAESKGLAFLTLSSRKVYAPSPLPLTETAELGRTDRYGEQKLLMEDALAGLLGERLTRLRLANIFGYERGRQSFMGAMLDGLASDATITFDMSPFTTRDFLDVETAAAWLAALARRPPGGIVNLGSGIALPTGKLALAVIEGFEKGRLTITRPEERDSFRLDTSRLERLIGAATEAEGLLQRARDHGIRLRRES